MKSHSQTIVMIQDFNAERIADTDITVDCRMKMFLFSFVLVFCSLIDLQAWEHVQEYVSVWVPVHSL
jgi:hypothetical protein